MNVSSNEEKKLITDLTYVHMASAMANAIAQVTRDSHTSWACFFMAMKDNPINQHLYNTTRTQYPLPDHAFHPVVVDVSLWYYLAGRMDIPLGNPLFPYQCYWCNWLGHWSWEHDQTQPYWELGMP
ncbi:hypothetical protein V8B97DRAFT_1917148 [Scleroderma yunnanense]